MKFDEVLAALRRHGARQQLEIYLVGGCVRDGLLGRPLVDVDVAVAGDALAFAQLLAQAVGGSYVSLGGRFGASRVVFPADPASVWQIDCSSLHGILEEDLRQRDFTVDALAVRLADFAGSWADAPVLDVVGGRADLDRRLLRMVSPDVFEADSLRMLRAVRLMAELDFALDPDTAAAIRERASLLRLSAPERARDELCRIIAAEGSVTWIELLDELGLLTVLLPELEQGRGSVQPKEHYWDVFTHQVETAAAVEMLVTQRLSPKLGDRPYLQAACQAALPWHDELAGYFEAKVGSMTRGALVKLAALVHDVAKPATKTIQPDGRIRFFGHEELGAEMVRDMLGRLRFSNHETDAIATMVAHHLRPGQWSSGELPTPRALYRYFRDLGEVAIDTIFLNLADHLGARGPNLDLPHWRQHVAAANDVLARYFEQEQRAVEPRLVTGRDLMDAFALQPGPLIGELLAQLEEAHATGDIATREQALALAGRLLETRQTAARP